MRKRKIARFGYLIISVLFCCAAFAVWLWPGYSPLAVTLPLLVLVFWASVAAKRHTLPQLISGVLIPLAWTVLLVRIL